MRSHRARSTARRLIERAGSAAAAVWLATTAATARASITVGKLCSWRSQSQTKPPASARHHAAHQRLGAATAAAPRATSASSASPSTTLHAESHLRLCLRCRWSLARLSGQAAGSWLESQAGFGSRTAIEARRAPETQACLATRARQRACARKPCQTTASPIGRDPSEEWLTGLNPLETQRAITPKPLGNR
jgi:hypothetical protein